VYLTNLEYQAFYGAIQSLEGISNPNQVRGYAGYQSFLRAQGNEKIKAVQLLIAVLTNHREGINTRKWAALLLGEIGDYDTVHPILNRVITTAGYAQWIKTEARNALGILNQRFPNRGYIPIWQ